MCRGYRRWLLRDGLLCRLAGVNMPHEPGTSNFDPGVALVSAPSMLSRSDLLSDFPVHFAAFYLSSFSLSFLH